MIRSLFIAILMFTALLFTACSITDPNNNPGRLNSKITDNENINIDENKKEMPVTRDNFSTILNKKEITKPGEVKIEEVKSYSGNDRKVYSSYEKAEIILDYGKYIFKSGECIFERTNGDVLKIPFDYIDYEFNRLFYFSYKNDLIIIFETGDGESGWSCISRIEKNSTNIIYCEKFGHFNLNCIMKDNYILFSTIGQVGRIDVDSGKVIWQDEGLYEKYGVNYSDEILISDNYVVYIGHPPVNEKDFKLEYNIETGQKKG